MSLGRMIGVVTPFLDGSLYGGFLFELNQIAIKRGYRLLVIKTPKTSSDFSIPLATVHAAGWIVFDSPLNESILNELQRQKRPIVGINHYSLHYPSIHFANEMGMEQAVEHLYQHGHRRIAFVGNLMNRATQSRYPGYVNAYRRLGLDPDPSLLVKIGTDAQAGGYLAADRIVSGELECTAVVTNSDITAIALMDRLKEKGYRVPEEIAVMGYDHNPLSEHTLPTVSTIKPPLREAARRSVSLLEAGMATGEQRTDPVHMNMTLIARESCGCHHEPESRLGDQEKLYRSFQLLNQSMSANRTINYLSYRDVEKLNNLSWMHSLQCIWGCYGQWFNKSPEQMYVKYYYTKEMSTAPTGEIQCSPMEFPPLHCIPEELLDDPKYIISIHPIIPHERDWGVMAMLHPVDESWSYFKTDTITYSLHRLASAWEKEELLAQLRKTNHLLETVSKAAMDAIFEWSADDKRFLWSERAHEFFQSPPATDADLLSSVHSEDRAAVQAALFNQTQMGYPIRLEYRIRQPDGKYLWVECNGQVIRDMEEMKVRLIGSIRDISERKSAEELLRKSEKLSVIGQLAAGVAHEIRNPLTSLKGFTQLLKARYQDQFPYIGIMESELDRINFIVTEFMSLAKPHLTHFSFKDITQIITTVVSILETQAILTGVNIETHFEAALPPIKCEENQLKQLFVNLLKNAIEAMPKGGSVYVDVTLASVNTLCVQIRDEGDGISPELIKKVGEPFFTTKEKGTGLGLMISHRIVEAHGGTLQIVSSDAGTTIEIILPFEPL
ncbi:substrate-binding domain-containing protein [Paenibacillus sp. GD4]|uniref:substrate-binding domain-containing protein n=1 Tax=Paenibacillus sp. GD4 TaxID=3068890 RepID=UPI002796D573|nr:substrate-binding domain-containing protein [Paenibacillus sp. GD4]MDQ1912540.1 substrate-binding domain-containing protein [Paenibacillus sp. GD4]